MSCCKLLVSSGLNGKLGEGASEVGASREGAGKEVDSTNRQCLAWQHDEAMYHIIACMHDRCLLMWARQTLLGVAAVRLCCPSCNPPSPSRLCIRCHAAGGTAAGACGGHRTCRREPDPGTLQPTRAPAPSPRGHRRLLLLTGRGGGGQAAECGGHRGHGALCAGLLPDAESAGGAAEQRADAGQGEGARGNGGRQGRAAWGDGEERQGQSGRSVGWTLDEWWSRAG